MESVKLGQLVTDPEQGRDAVHVAVIPLIAVREMRPGERLANGIVDPFLTAPVKPGGRFLLCLYPNTVTSLRHAWTHPAFPAEAEPVESVTVVPRRSEANVWTQMEEVK